MLPDQGITCDEHASSVGPVWYTGIMQSWLIKFR